MAITLTDLRSLNGTGSILVDSKTPGGGSLKSASLLQRFKSFFNIGNARDRNKATIVAIGNALRASGEFNSVDLLRKADAMLDKVRTDRAIGAAEIKSIMMELDSLAGNLDARVTLNVAARGFPPGAERCGQKAIEVAQRLVRQDRDNGTPIGNLDIPGRTNEAMQACACALRSVQPLTGEPAEPELTDLIARDVSRYVLLGDGTLRPPRSIQFAVENACDFYRNASAAIEARLAPDPGDPVAAVEASLVRDEVRQSALAFLHDAGSPVDAAMFDAIDAHVRKAPLHELSDLRPNATAPEILGALRSFARAVNPAKMQLPVGVHAPASDKGQAALLRFLCQWAAVQMPAANRRALLDLLESVAGEKARSIPAQLVAAKVPAAVLEDAAIGELMGILRKLDGRPAVDAPPPYPADITGFSPADRCAYRPGDAFAGNAAPKLRDAILGNAGIPATGATAAEQLHRRIDTGTRTLLDGSFASVMKDISEAIDDEFEDDPDGIPSGPSVPPPGTDPEDLPAARFDHAFRSGVPQFGGSLEASPALANGEAPLFRMPDGTRLPSDDPAAARDALARVATGRPDADYATLAHDERARTNVLIGLVSCNPFEAAEQGVNTGLSPDKDSSAFRLSCTDGALKMFQLSGSPAEGFVVRCGSSKPLDGVAFDQGGNGRFVNGGGLFSSMMELRLSPADVDRLAKQDWKSFDDESFKMEIARPDMDFGNLAATVPQELRLGGEVSAAFSLDFDE